MRRHLLRAALAAAFLVLGAAVPQDADDDGSGGMRFRAVDVLVDPAGAPLAAWQIEVTGDLELTKIVGLEGGEVPHFSAAPRYDPAALKGGRIIIAAFSLGDGPPSEEVRVARLHLVETGGRDLPLVARAMAAARPGGERIPIKVRLVESGGN